MVKSASILKLSAALLGFAAGATRAAADDAEAAQRAARLAGVKCFAYQLQKLDPAKAAACGADLIVVDPQREAGRLSPEQVAALKKKPDGSARIVLAYLSIGEAEDYRPYWKAAWKAKPPAWLGPENPDWKGNFKVRYWDPAWQAIILGAADRPLDRIAADGYDGVYLDIVDGFEFWSERGEKGCEARMAAWVAAIAAHARKARPGFLVVPQNGEALVGEAGYLGVVDAIGREDLFFNGDKPQPKADTADVLRHLAGFRKAGKAVFVIEYCKKAKNADDAIRRARDAGFLPLVTVRPLDQLIVSPK